jgi:hypothetical protein
VRRGPRRGLEGRRGRGARGADGSGRGAGGGWRGGRARAPAPPGRTGRRADGGRRGALRAGLRREAPGRRAGPREPRPLQGARGDRRHRGRDPRDRGADEAARRQLEVRSTRRGARAPPPPRRRLRRGARLVRGQHGADGPHRQGARPVLPRGRSRRDLAGRPLGRQAAHFERPARHAQPPRGEARDRGGAVLGLRHRHQGRHVALAHRLLARAAPAGGRAPRRDAQPRSVDGHRVFRPRPEPRPVALRSVPRRAERRDGGAPRARRGLRRRPRAQGQEAARPPRRAARRSARRGRGRLRRDDHDPRGAGDGRRAEEALPARDPEHRPQRVQGLPRLLREAARDRPEGGRRREGEVQHRRRRRGATRDRRVDARRRGRDLRRRRDGQAALPGDRREDRRHLSDRVLPRQIATPLRDLPAPPASCTRRRSVSGWASGSASRRAIDGTRWPQAERWSVRPADRIERRRSATSSSIRGHPRGARRWRNRCSAFRA